VAAPNASLSAVDRALLAELEVLEQAAPRHYEWVVELIAPWLGRDVLEVGSGTGLVSKLVLPRCRRLLVSDYQPAIVERLRERFGHLPGVEARLLDLTRRPYDLGGARLDTILCLNVLEHLEEDEAILAALAAVLPAGGRLVLQVPNGPWLYGSLDRAYGHVRRYTPALLRRRLEAAGLRVAALRRFNALSIPGWILTGRVLRRERLDPRALRAYDRLVPLARALDPWTRFAGVALLACGEKR
jgi:SAM-dependent methyltransferase